MYIVALPSSTNSHKYHISVVYRVKKTPKKQKEQNIKFGLVRNLLCPLNFNQLIFICQICQFIINIIICTHFFWKSHSKVLHILQVIFFVISSVFYTSRCIFFESSSRYRAVDWACLFLHFTNPPNVDLNVWWSLFDSWQFVSWWGAHEGTVINDILMLIAMFVFVSVARGLF